MTDSPPEPPEAIATHKCRYGSYVRKAVRGRAIRVRMVQSSWGASSIISDTMRSESNVTPLAVDRPVPIKVIAITVIYITLIVHHSS